MSATADERGSGKLTAEEREAMKERAREARAEAKRGKGLAAAAADLADVVKEAKAAGRGAILLGVKRRGAPTQYVTVRLEK